MNYLGNCFYTFASKTYSPYFYNNFDCTLQEHNNPHGKPYKQSYIYVALSLVVLLPQIERLFHKMEENNIKNVQLL